MDQVNPVVWQYIALGFIALSVTIIVLWAYNRREGRRKHANQLAKLMSKWGLDWFAEGYEMYAVGDYSGLVHKVREIVQSVRSDTAMVAKLDDCFWKVLDYYKGDPSKVAEILKRLPAQDAPEATV